MSHWLKTLRNRPFAAAAGLALAVALGALLAVGSVRQPPDGRPAGILTRDATASPLAPASVAEGLRVAQFNIRRGRGRDGVTDLWRTASCLTGVDIAGLNEVDGGTPLDTGIDQGAILARWLGLASIYSATERRYWHDHFGNALLTALPITHWVRLSLPRAEGPSHRSLLSARVLLDGTPVTVMVSHADRRGDRARQVTAILDHFLQTPPPAILVGDLNTVAEEPLMAPVLTRGDVVAVSHSVDWILARGFRQGAVSLCDVGASDHARVAVDLYLEESDGG